MKWTLKDKIVIPTILPLEGSLLTKTLCRDIKTKLEVTVDEVKGSGLESTEKGVTWKDNIEVKVTFTKDELSLLRSSAEEVANEEKVNDDNLELIEKLLA